MLCCCEVCRGVSLRAVGSPWPLHPLRGVCLGFTSALLLSPELSSGGLSLPPAGQSDWRLCAWLWAGRWRSPLGSALLCSPFWEVRGTRTGLTRVLVMEGTKMTSVCVAFAWSSLQDSCTLAGNSDRCCGVTRLTSPIALNTHLMCFLLIRIFRTNKGTL